MSHNPRTLPWRVLREDAGLSRGQVVKLAREADVRRITTYWLRVLETPGEPQVHPTPAQSAWLRETYGAEDQEALAPLLDRLRARSLHPRPGQAYLDSLIPGARQLHRDWLASALNNLHGLDTAPHVLLAAMDGYAGICLRRKHEAGQHKPVARAWLAEPKDIRADVVAIALDRLRSTHR